MVNVVAGDSDEANRPQYQLVGECYLEGHMDGHAFADMRGDPQSNTESVFDIF